MQLRPEDVQDIVNLLDSLSHDEFELRTSELHLTVRRAGSEGWTQESRVLSAPNVVATDSGGAQPEPGCGGGEHPLDDSGGAQPEPGCGGGEHPLDDSVAADPATADRAAHDPVRPGLVGIRAPLPGTFYRAAKPGADPYVEVGSRVEEDTVVGLLETMKLFNSVHANVRGEVVEFLVDDAGPADQDAVLIVVRPDTFAGG
jgi:acetyl-CoA carboxylase biotin carboxyl carrier protein